MTDGKQHLFEEIRPESESDSCDRPSLIEAYATIVEPKQCGPLVKQLSRLLPLTQPTIDLSHLKRVKRSPLRTKSTSSTDENNNLRVEGSDPPRKKQKARDEDFQLRVLLGAVSAVDVLADAEGDHDVSNGVRTLLAERKVEKVMVAARLADTEEEHKQFQSHWPTSFFPNKTLEHRQKERELSSDEIQQMIKGMTKAIDDAHQHAPNSSAAGVVIVSPESGKVVARASVEHKLQYPRTDGNITNPLATSILFAVQGVSRMERQVAESKGMDSESFQHGQYLCTGYDVYATLEPTVFEAMALVHSRVRRVVFGTSSKTIRGGMTEMKVHALPGTNHHYRAFSCRPDSELWNKCRQLHGLS